MGHILFSFLFYNVLLIIFYKHYKKGDYYIKKSDLVKFTILLIAFGTLGTGEGDYLHYKESVALFQSLNDVYFYNGMELQYNYLAYLVGGNNTLWRLVIFSVQFIGMSWLLYKAKLNTYPVYLCFIAICLVLYTYQRSYWGVILYFIGLYLLLEKKNPLFLIVIVLCYFSHTQNIVLLVLLPLGFINLRAWQLLFVILFVSVLATTLGDYFTMYIDSGGIEDAEYLNMKLARYSQGGKSYFGSSIGEIIVFILRYVPVAIIVFYWMKMIIANRKIYLSFYKPNRGMMNVAIGLVLLSLVIMFANLGTGTFFYRILAMSLFPISLSLPYMVGKDTLNKKLFNNIITIYIIDTEIGYIKDLYYAYVSGITW